MAWGSKTTEDLVLEAEGELSQIQDAINEAYEKVKDFSVDAVTADKAIAHIKELNKKKAAAERKIAKLKE